MPNVWKRVQVVGSGDVGALGDDRSELLEGLGSLASAHGGAF